MKRVNLIRHLVDHGCYLHREGSRHEWWRNPEGGQGAVPRHNEIKDVLARQICRTLRIPPPRG